MISLTEIQQLPNYTQTLELFDVIYQGDRFSIPEELKTRREWIQYELTPKGDPAALWVHPEGVEVLFEETCCQLSTQLPVVARTRLYRQGVRPLGSAIRIQGNRRYFSSKDSEPLSLETATREEYQHWRQGIREQLVQEKVSISEKERAALGLMLQILDLYPPVSTSIFEIEIPEGMTAVSCLKQAAKRRKDHRHHLTDITTDDHQVFRLLSMFVAVQESELLTWISKTRLKEYFNLSLIAKFSINYKDYYKLSDKGKSFVEESLNEIQKEELLQQAMQAFQQKEDEMVILNLQTTNFLPDSEIIHLAILQPNGHLLYEKYFKPSSQIFRPILEKTELTHEVLARADFWKTEWPTIQACLSGKQILTDNGSFILEKLLSNTKRYQLEWEIPLKVMDLGDYFKQKMNVKHLQNVYQQAFSQFSLSEFYNARCRAFLLGHLIHPTWDLMKQQATIESLFQQYCESTTVEALTERQAVGWKWIQQVFRLLQSPNTFRALSGEECCVLDERLNRALQLVKSKNG